MAGRKPRAPGLPARVRAAIAYADLTQKEVAKQLHVSDSTVNRWMTGPDRGDYRPPDADQRAELARLCRVPPSFLHHGWPDVVVETNGDVERRLERLERVTDAMITAAAEQASLPRQQSEPGDDQTEAA